MFWRHISVHFFSFNSLAMIHPMPARWDRPAFDENKNVSWEFRKTFLLLTNDDLQNQPLITARICRLINQFSKPSSCFGIQIESQPNPSGRHRTNQWEWIETEKVHINVQYRTVQFIVPVPGTWSREDGSVRYWLVPGTKVPVVHHDICNIHRWGAKLRRQEGATRRSKAPMAEDDDHVNESAAKKT